MVPHNRPTLERPDLDEVARTLASGHIAQGREVRLFEEELSRRFGRPGWQGVAVSSGTAALYLALRARGVGTGDRVLIPTYVCSALVHAVRLTGAEVVLRDVRAGDFNLDTSLVEGDVRPAAAIVPHIYGVPCDLSPLQRQGIPVIEDAAQATGARWHGQPVGRFGDLSVFSFYATKPITCGQGGMVLGPPEACDAIRDYRDYDGKPDLRPRFNFQMTDFQAALGRSQLRRLDHFVARRHETATLYQRALPPCLDRQRPVDGAEPNHFRFVLRLDGVETARARFTASGVTTIIPTEAWELLHRQLGLDRGGFPVAEALAHSTLSLPIHPSLSDEERRRVADVLASLGDLR